MVQKDNDLLHSIGKLAESNERLKKEESRPDGVDPEVVSDWILLIGKALLGVFGIGTGK